MSDDPARRRRRIVWILVTIFSTAAIAVLAHAASQRLDWRWVLLVRSVGGCALAWGILRMGGSPGAGQGARWPLATMSVFAGLSAGAYFFALAGIPSADAMVLRGAAPLWVVVAAWLLLGQTVPLGLWVGLGCGFVGMVLVQQPHLSAGNVGAIAGVASGVLAAASQDALRRLRHVPAIWSVFVLSWVSLAVAAAIILVTMDSLDTRGFDDPWAWGLAGGTAVFGTLGSVAVTRAVTLASVQVVSASTYAAVGLGAIADAVWFATVPTAVGLAGLVLTTVPTIYAVLHRPRTRDVHRATFAPATTSTFAIDPAPLQARLRDAERVSSCEFRVHLETGEAELTAASATRLFARLGMTSTRLRNGVLVAISPRRGEVLIVVDTGILEVASTRLLHRSIAAMATTLERGGDPAAAVGDEIVHLARALARWFPIQDDDIDELPNDLSVG